MKNIRNFGITAALLVVGFAAQAQSKDSTSENRMHVKRDGHSFRHSDRSKFEHFDRQSRYAYLPGLTEDQQKNIDALKTPYEKDVMSLRNQLAEKKTHLHTLQTADKADLTAVNKTIDEIGGLESQLMKKSAAHREDVRKLLTDEQKLAFDSRKGRGHMHRKGGDRFKG